MHPTTFLATALFIASTLADCIPSSDANLLANNFGTLVSAYSETLANQTLTPNFIDYSESVNTLVNSGTTAPKGLLDLTFDSRAAFESLSAAQPAVPFTVKNLWANCDTITVRWQSDQTPQPVVGISVLHAAYTSVEGNPSAWQIDELWGEFDSAAWLVNEGCVISECPVAASKARRELVFRAWGGGGVEEIGDGGLVGRA